MAVELAQTAHPCSAWIVEGIASLMSAESFESSSR